MKSHSLNYTYANPEHFKIPKISQPLYIYIYICYIYITIVYIYIHIHRSLGFWGSMVTAEVLTTAAADHLGVCRTVSVDFWDANLRNLPF